MRYLVALFATFTLLVACGRGQSVRRADAPRTILEVDNRGFADMTVYVINAGQRIRLGTATGNSTTKLTIPPSVLTGARQLQFLADPIGGRRTAVSDQIYVSPGDQVTLTIPPG